MAGPATMSPATVAVLAEDGYLLVGVVGVGGAMRCSPRRVKRCGGLGGEVGEAVVRGVLRLATGVRFAVVGGSPVTWSEVWGW